MSQPEPASQPASQPASGPTSAPARPAAAKPPPVAEIGGPKGPEPTRYGDWEIGGRVSDF
ncbi:MAG: DUF1674 domain-containing protein [Alphaproteobacteria bacterium]